MLKYIPGILTRSQIKKILGLIQEEGFIDGKKTAGFRAKLVKNNEQLASDFPGKKEINDIVISSLRKNPDFQRASYPKKILNPLISRYHPGMEYGFHVDDAMMGGADRVRTDVSVTVFLNNPDEYEGGSLEIDSPFGPQSIKLPAGSAVVYPSSTLHRVEPVTKGERLVAVTWLESFIREPAEREILADLDRVRKKLHSLEAKSPETDLAFKTYTNLLRRWSNT